MKVNINKPIDQLAAALTRAEAKQEFLRKKIEEIEDNADDHGRDYFTASEQDRVDKLEELEEHIMDLEAQIDAINNALDYLNEYYI